MNAETKVVIANHIVNYFGNMKVNRVFSDPKVKEAFKKHTMEEDNTCNLPSKGRTFKMSPAQRKMNEAKLEYMRNKKDTAKRTKSHLEGEN